MGMFDEAQGHVDRERQRLAAERQVEDARERARREGLEAWLSHVKEAAEDFHGEIIRLDLRSTGPWSFGIDVRPGATIYGGQQTVLVSQDGDVSARFATWKSDWYVPLLDVRPDQLIRHSEATRHAGDWASRDDVRRPFIETLGRLIAESEVPEA